MRLCDECDGVHFAKGKCVKHYNRLRRKGSTAEKVLKQTFIQVRISEIDKDKIRRFVDSSEFNGIGEFLIAAANEKINRHQS